MNPLYNLGMRAFDAGISLGALKSEKIKKLRTGQKEAIGYLRGKIRPGQPYVWIHAASLGEFEQGRPLIEKIRRENSDVRILLTFFSPSGYEVRKNFSEVDAVCYLPLDVKSRVKEFLDVVNPRMAVFVKYEFWGNYLQELKRRGVPTYIISSIFRPSQIFFKPWGAMFRNMLRCYTHVYVQDERSRRLLAGIGVTNVTVAGDTRFDRVTDIMRSCVEIPQAAAFVEKAPVTIIAGSTWPPDEEYLIPYFNSHPEFKLIIAPHEVESKRLDAIERSLTRKSCRLSSATLEEAREADCMIIDGYGKLSSIYSYGDIAYVGGGFGVGIHNINEAAVYGMPVLFGPNYHKFKEAYDLIEAKGAFTFSDIVRFEGILSRLLTDSEYLAECGNNASRYIKENFGATDVIYGDIKSLLDSLA